MRIAGVLAGLALALQMAAAGAQEMGNLAAPRVKAKNYVAYAAEEQVVAAGKQSVLELQFRVADGFHVNSHMPKSELLIPTQIALQPATGVKLSPVEYPAGTTYRLSADPTEKLDVYSGAFTVKVPVVAAAGEHTVDGVLRYQACDRAACYPPRSLPVQVIFTAK